jgi:Na+/glutamate symporter
MDKIRELTRNPLATAIVGFVVGLIIGLPILGWGLWPVKWENADPARLRADYMQDYLCTTIDSYARKQDAAAAQSRFELLGTQGQKLLVP